MRKWKVVPTFLLAGLLAATSARAIDWQDYEYAKRGDPKALVPMAKAILEAKSTNKVVNDLWGATCLLAQSLEKGNKKALDLLKEKHNSLGNAYAFLLKGVLDSCEEGASTCEPFATDGPDKKSLLKYIGICYERGDDSTPNAYCNGMDFTLCIGPLGKYKATLAENISNNALDVAPDLLADLYMASTGDVQLKLAPAVQKESASLVAARFLSDKNFEQARFWYQKADDQNGLAEVEKKEKALAEFEAAKRKAEADALTAREDEKRKAVAAEAEKQAADLKAEADRKASEQRIKMDRQAAEQRLEMQRKEMENQLTHDREVAERKLAEEKATASAEADKKLADGLKSGSIQVANLKDAVIKYGAKDAAPLIQKPPLSPQEGYWAMKGVLKSVETGVSGQSGNVYMCASPFGMFAFVSDKNMSHLSINQGVGVVGRHTATQEGYQQSMTGAKAVIYIPIFKAVEVLGD